MTRGCQMTQPFEALNLRLSLGPFHALILRFFRTPIYWFCLILDAQPTADETKRQKQPYRNAHTGWQEANQGSYATG
ncbi:MAG: hypothetical protein ACPGL0_14605, partial [Limisphaerales bacterium]